MKAAWTLVLFLISTTVARADDTIFLMGADAFATECSSPTQCSQDPGEYMMMIPLVSESPNAQSGTFSDFSHLPTGELFMYEFSVQEELNKIQISMNCKLESATGETLYECPTKTNTAKKRSSLKKFQFVNVLSSGSKKYKVHVSYQKAE